MIILKRIKNGPYVKHPKFQIRCNHKNSNFNYIPKEFDLKTTLKNEKEIIIKERSYPKQKYTEKYYALEAIEQDDENMGEIIIPTISIEGLNQSLIPEKLLKTSCIIPSSATNSTIINRAKHIASQLGIPLIETLSQAKTNPDIRFILNIGQISLSLSYINKKTNDVHTVKTSLENEYLKRTYDKSKSIQEEKKRPLIKAIQTGISNPTILDATGGFGVDAFSIAYVGYNITILERNPIMYALLYDSMMRASQNHKIKPIIDRMKLLHADAFNYLEEIEEKPDVIYLDPMYPSIQKRKALSKLPITIARELLFDEKEQTKELLDLAKKHAKHHTVLKRPINASNPGANKVFKSKDHLWEIYYSNKD